MADVPLPADTLDDDVNVTGVQPVVDVDLSAKSTSLGPALTGQTSTAGDDVTLDLGDDRKTVSFAVDTSASATLTVEMRSDGGTWRTADTIDYGSAVSTVETYETGFEQIRASVDTALNALEGSAKGV